MSLAADIRAEQESQPGPKCTVPQVLADLTPDDAADLEAALLDERITAAAIARALKNRRIGLGEYTIARHRRRACQCPA